MSISQRWSAGLGNPRVGVNTRFSSPFFEDIAGSAAPGFWTNGYMSSAVAGAAPGSQFFAGDTSAGGTTLLSDTESGVGTETGDVSATVPGSDSGAGTETGTVFATLSGSDSATGTDAQVSIVAPVAGSETAAGSETGSVSATVSGADAAAGSDTGAVSVTAPGSDFATGSEAGVVTETGAGGEGGAGFESGTVSVTAAGSEAASGSEAGTASVTASGSDSATGTDAGTVVDVTTGGPTLISDSDSAVGTETSAIVKTDAPVDEEDRGDESAIYPQPPTMRRVYGSDFAVGLDIGEVADLTPRKVQSLRVILPERRRRDAHDVESARAFESHAVLASAGSADAARGSESGHVEDVTPEDPYEIPLVLELLLDG